MKWTPPIKPSGFTLLELLVTIAVAAILMAIALPAFDRLVRDMRTESAAWSIFNATQAARSYAVKSNMRVTMLANPTWRRGWQIFYDENHNGLYDEQERLIQTQGELHESIEVKGNRPVEDYISYLGTGESRWASGEREGAFQAGTLTVCPADEGPGFALVLSRGGRLRTEKLNNEECSTST
ncbi:GspH/FimT family pseudopilin [Gilvimarinus algae]|uniref:Type II secretion system protein H n=1 Tax=Gilvimarinus algae TaxID=3058037 RepID=A0ABT8T9L9_9GAMM|nr:GspH/FimT family pseudopilin [Gilvimarinus sp. SDUM040014]MDO3380792.1 GspH/FimT family pseudopilin [Gilvimarinus sp. SDUM040014]